MVAVSIRSANCRRVVQILPTPRAQSQSHDSGMEAGTEGILQCAGRWERAESSTRWHVEHHRGGGGRTLDGGGGRCRNAGRDTSRHGASAPGSWTAVHRRRCPAAGRQSRAADIDDVDVDVDVTQQPGGSGRAGGGAQAGAPAGSHVTAASAQLPLQAARRRRFQAVHAAGPSTQPTSATTTTTQPTEARTAARRARGRHRSASRAIGPAPSTTSSTAPRSNTNNWVPQVTAASGYVNGATACYVDNPDTISVSGGYLNLTALQVAPFTCEDGSNSFTTSYEAGMVSTNGLFDQTYGASRSAPSFPRPWSKACRRRCGCIRRR